MAQVFTPEISDADRDLSQTSVFLAGTIEMGKSIDWQSEAINLLAEEDVAIFNPRRVVPPENTEEVARQINWELDRLDKSSVIFMRLLAGSISPISLLELGLFLQDGTPLIIVCDPGYTRKENVYITVERFGDHSICHLVDSMEDGISILKNYIATFDCLRDCEDLI